MQHCPARAAQRLAAAVLALVLLLCAFLPRAHAAELKEKNGIRLLSFDTSHILSIGNQTSGKCSLYALRYARTILDGKVCSGSGMWSNGAVWSAAGYTGYAGTRAECLKKLYNELAAGRPVIVHLKNTTVSGVNKHANRTSTYEYHLSGSGWNDPKTAREAKQRQKEHSTNLLYGTIGVVFLVIAIAAVIWKSNIIPKTATAATVNGEKYTAAEVNFYFENYYQNFVNGNYSILSMIGLDTGTSLKDQTISSSAVMFVTDATEGETWYDYFADKALEQLAGVQAMNAAAEAEGFTWNDEMQADLDDTMESLASAASTYGYTEKQYLGLIYGSTMTRSIYEEQTRRSLLATAYLQSYQDSLTYSTDELEAAYQEDRTAYDLVDCAYVRVNGAAADTDEEGNSIEVTDEMKAEAMAAAKTTADAIYAAYKAGTSLEDAAAEYESTATYASSDSFSYSSSVLGEWLYDDARQAGDSAVLEDSDSSNYYVVVFNGRSRNEYNTVNVRHILIQPEASELSEDDEGYEDDVAAKDAEAAQKAQDILDEWKAGDATEDSFAALANEYSQDPGSNTTGGLYEQVYQGQMVTEFNDWCFDPARQTGDTGIIHNESTGYHVMYFVGYDQPYWEIQVSADLVNDAVDTFYEEKTEGYTAEQSSFGMSFVG